MAIIWDTAIIDGSNGMRLGREIVQYPSAINSGTNSVDLVLNLYVWTRRSVYDSHNNFVRSGHWGNSSGSVTINHGSNVEWSTSNRTRIYHGVITVPTSYLGTVTRSFTASLSGVNAAVGSASTSGSHTVGRRPFLVPNPPNNVQVSRVSDTVHNVTWVRTHTEAGPWTNIIIQRWDSVVGSYQTIDTISGTASSYQDHGTVANRRYRYRVAARNTSGTSAYKPSEYFYTSPGMPDGAAARKLDDSILVEWTRHAYAVAHYQVEIYVNGVLDDTVTTLANVSSYTHTNPDTSANSYYYRVRARYTDAVVGVLASEWSTPSNTVQVASPPLKPTNLSPTAAIDTDRPVTISWQHNPVDTSAQRAYEVIWRPVGSSAWTQIGPVFTDDTQPILPDGTWANGMDYEWQVRTYGDHPDPSPWSDTATVPTSAAPSATFITPTPEVLDSQVVAEWEFYDAEGGNQSAYQLVLFDEGENVLWQEDGGAARLVPVDYELANGSSYKLSLWVRDGDLIWSDPIEIEFSVTY